MGRALTLCCLFCLPLKHLSVTSDFGYRIHPITKQYQFHAGTDLRAHGDTVYAIIRGRATIGFDRLLGLNIRLVQNDLEITYGHLSQLLLAGDSVACGDAIAITGASGQTTGEHLHLSIKYHGQPIDPLKFLYEFTLKQYNHE